MKTRWEPVGRHHFGSSSSGLEWRMMVPFPLPVWAQDVC